MYAYCCICETGKIITDKETKIRVSDLMMDNRSLSMTFEITLVEEIKEILTADEVKGINLPDIVVYDENNLVLYALDDRTIDKCCEKNNIIY